ncbi:MAG TPA: hypothetical protein GXZ36_04825 [Firmicutes bacterium]|nr:hypothetical protein [Bacillota bacterium]
MKVEEIDLMANRLYKVFGRRIGLNLSKIRKCVSAIVNLDDEEITAKLREKLL